MHIRYNAYKNVDNEFMEVYMTKDTNNNLRNQLEEFENDNNFKLLKQKYETPNAFTIMGNKRREEWHSSFVSWLLDPKQNHRLGKFPLERFIRLAEKKSKNFEIDTTSISDMNFETEHKTNDGRSIDIFGKSPALVLVIENKIKANETYKNGKPQSNDYYRYCEENYQDRQRCYVLLKAFLDSRLENENFIPVTYQELFDDVIEPACKYCEELGLEDTKRVLEQYALDISNPFASIILAHTQKDLSNKIYSKHKNIIEEIRVAMRENERDEESDVCKFFNKNMKYINNVILQSLGIDIIAPRKSDLQSLKGAELLKTLLDYGIIIPNQTEIIYKFMSATCIIMVDENHKYYTGYYPGTDYDGSQEVDILESGLDRLRDAEIVVETAVGSRSINKGKSAYELMLLHAGNKESEGEKIGDILEKL